MRLIIQFMDQEIRLPINYRHFLQGAIYRMLPEDGYGDFLHNQGYEGGKKVFKLFTFSDLLGHLKVEKETIIFFGTCSWQIASVDEELIDCLYKSLISRPQVLIGNVLLTVSAVNINELPYFSGSKEVIIRTISPVTAYRSEGKRFEYFAPGSRPFEEICLQNLQRKAEACPQDQQPEFSIEEVLFSKKRIARFKQTFYVSYMTELKIKTNFAALNLIMNTGLSAKGSAGFGMVRLVHE